MLDQNTGSHLTVQIKKCPQTHLEMLSTKYVYTNISNMICKEDLALSNPQWLICHKMQPNQQTIFHLLYQGQME